MGIKDSKHRERVHKNVEVSPVERNVRYPDAQGEESKDHATLV